MDLAVPAAGLLLPALMPPAPGEIHSPLTLVMSPLPTPSIQINACAHMKEVLTFKSSSRITESRQLLHKIDTYNHINYTYYRTPIFRVGLEIHSFRKCPFCVSCSLYIHIFLDTCDAHTYAGMKGTS